MSDEGASRRSALKKHLKVASDLQISAARSQRDAVQAHLHTALQSAEHLAMREQRANERCATLESQLEEVAFSPPPAARIPRAAVRSEHFSSYALTCR